MITCPEEGTLLVCILRDSNRPMWCFMEKKLMEIFGIHAPIITLLLEIKLNLNWIIVLLLL
jgi:hypothetical protein